MKQNLQGHLPSEPLMPVDPSTLTMKWHKFLVNFALYAAAVLNVLSAFQLLVISGTGVFALDLMLSVMYIALAVFNIYARFRLAGFHRNGPNCIYLNYILSAAVQVIYSLSKAGVGPEPFNLEAVQGPILNSVLTVVIFVWANHTYFTKRADLYSK